MDSVQDIIRKKRVNLRKFKSVLTEINDLNEEKRSVLENMKHDFFAHLSDRQSDRNDRHRRSTTTIRQHYQSLLMQIPSNIQELTLEDIYSCGGSLDVLEGTDNCLTVSMKIPKSMINSTDSVVKSFTQNKSSDENHKTFREVNLLKSTLTKSVRTSNRKAIQKPIVMTRSQMKTTTKRDVLNRPEPEKSVQEPKKVQILRSISGAQMKTARKPIPNEEIVTLEFSTSGTPLLMDAKSKDRIKQ